MAIFFLAVIYLAFISLGLPDSVLGAAWPAMRQELGASLSMAGVLSMTISCGTILSSTLSSRVIDQLGTGKTTLISVLLTAVALAGWSTAPSAPWLVVWAIPLGLGAGAVDAGLNDYVATHYQAKHMNWLHCFWGIGATVGPMLVAQAIRQGGSWRRGYGEIAVIQLVLCAFLLGVLPLWKRQEGEHSHGEKAGGPGMTLGQLLGVRGVKPTLMVYMLYSATESTAGLWAGSYFAAYRGYSPAKAAAMASLFYGSITLGRLVSGLVTGRLGGRRLIRLGQGAILLGGGLLLLPGTAAATAGMALVGLGCAPIFPSMLHETPVRFGKEISHRVMGVQMAVAYLGGMVLSPLFGVVAARSTTALYPGFLMLYTLLMAYCFWRAGGNVSEL